MWYSLTIVNVGLDISLSNPKYFKIPCVNFVFPEPSSPVKTIISPVFNLEARLYAKDIVSASLFVIKLLIFCNVNSGC